MKALKRIALVVLVHVVNCRDPVSIELPLGGGLRLRYPQPIQWRDLTISVDRRNQTPILKRSSGIAEPGRLLVVIGSSGAGKSTLLAGIAGSTPPGRKISGSVRFVSRDSSGSDNTVSDGTPPDAEPTCLNGTCSAKLVDSINEIKPEVVSVSTGAVGMLPQDDSFFTFLTVHETLMGAAQLQLPELDRPSRERLVGDAIQTLGLGKVAHLTIGGGSGGARGNNGNGNGNALNGRKEWMKDRRRSFGSFGVGPRAGGRGGKGRLSGGEKRRLSLALELLSGRKLLVADEPTTGLDSFTALHVMKLLKRFAVTQQVPVVASLHQPSSTLWHQVVDDVLLLTPTGRVAYHGPAGGAVGYFESPALGHQLQLNLQATAGQRDDDDNNGTHGGGGGGKEEEEEEGDQGGDDVVDDGEGEWHEVATRLRCPPFTNPAEFLIDLVSVDYTDPLSGRRDMRRCEALADAWEQLNQEQEPRGLGSGVVRPDHHHHHQPVTLSLGEEVGMAEGSSSTSTSTSSGCGGGRSVGGGLGVGRGLLLGRQWRRFGARFKCLVARCWRQNARDVTVNGLRAGVSVGLVFVFGAVFGQVGGQVVTPRNSADRVALLSYAVINMAMMGVTKSLQGFGREARAVRRERLQRLYSGVEYLASKALVELPLDSFLSALFGALLHLHCQPRQSSLELASALALTAAASSALGLAVGACTPSPDAALAVGTPLMIVLMILGVKNPSGVAPDSNQPPRRLPLPLRLLSAISPVRWGVEAVAIAEFSGADLTLGLPPSAPQPRPTSPWTGREEGGVGSAPTKEKQGEREAERSEGAGGLFATAPAAGAAAGAGAFISWLREHFDRALKRVGSSLPDAIPRPAIGMLSTKVETHTQIVRGKDRESRKHVEGEVTRKKHDTKQTNTCSCVPTALCPRLTFLYFHFLLCPVGEVSTGDEVLRRLGITPHVPPSRHGDDDCGGDDDKDKEGARSSQCRPVVLQAVSRASTKRRPKKARGSSSSSASSDFAGSWKVVMGKLAVVTAAELGLAALALSTVQRPKVVLPSPPHPV